MDPLRIVVAAPYSYPNASERHFVRGLKASDHNVQPIPSRDAAAVRMLPGSLADVVIVVGPPLPTRVLPRQARKVYVQMDHLSRGHAAENWYAAGEDGGYDALFNPHLQLFGTAPTDAASMQRMEKGHRLLLGYDPEDHAEVPWASTQDIPCIFVATWRPEREWVMRVPEVRVVGNDWGHAQGWTVRVAIGGAMHGSAFRDVITRSRIHLNQHYPPDLANLRFYETLAMGGLLLTDKHPPGEDWEPGKHFLQYKDTADAVSFIHQWANVERKEREQVARAGREHVKPFTWQRSMDTLLKEVTA